MVKFIFPVLLMVFWASCSKPERDEVVDEVKGYAKFSKTEVVVPSKGGQSSAVVVWDKAEWEIETITEGGFITSITPVSGGSDNGSNLTTITFIVAKNSETTIRSQDVFVVDKRTGTKEKLVVKQETLPITVVDAATKYQPVVGFGGMYNPAIWLPSQERIDANELAKMYDPAGMLKYSILRLMIYPDKTMWAQDVAGALQAQSYGAVIFACPWDCTDALADYVDVLKGGVMVKHKHLPAANYEAYANHLIEYVNFMKANGVNLYAISVQNEPDMDFTYWTPAEIATFTANYGARIRETGVKLMSPEALGFHPDYTNAIINSTEAFANTDIVVGHTYQGFTDLSSSYVKNRHAFITGLYPGKLASAGKTWWMTEKLFNDGHDETDITKQVYKKWSYNLDALGLEMHMCMEGYCSAYVYWYLKRFYGMIGDNDSRGFVAEGEVMKNGYIMAHYSAYATGMTRIKITVPDANVLATAYVDATGGVVTVVAQNVGKTTYETLLKMPSKILSHSAVETAEGYNMKSVETTLSDDLTHLKITVSPRSIYSLKITL
jgi:glucuronoarabinoxylan endo-1,4-beta-xylanase